ncbi:MAG: hypothetical protein AB8G99_04160 [Planctomycetaceae bacterium]
MQNSMWKFATLLGVIGVGCLVIIQVQKNLKTANAAATASKEVTPAGEAVPQFGAQDPLAGLADPGKTPFELSQFEPGNDQFEPAGNRFAASDDQFEPVGGQAEPGNDRVTQAGYDPSGQDDSGFDNIAFDDSAFGDSPPAAQAPPAQRQPAPQESAGFDDDDAFAGFGTMDSQPAAEPRRLTAQQPVAAQQPDAFDDAFESTPTNDRAAQPGMFDDEQPAFGESRSAQPPQDLPAADDIFGDDPMDTYQPQADPVPAADAGRVSLDPAAPPSLPAFDNNRPTDDAWPELDDPNANRIGANDIDRIDANGIDFGDRNEPVNDRREPVFPDETPVRESRPIRPIDNWSDQPAPVDPISYSDEPGILDQEPTRVEPLPIPTEVETEEPAIRATPNTRYQKSFDSVPHGTLRPQLRIEKTAPGSASLGKPLIYSIFIKNVGNAVANDVVVEDQIPRGARLTGTVPVAELVDGILMWKFDSLEPQQQKEIKIRVIPEKEGKIGSVATVNFKAEIGAQTTVTAPRLRLELTGQQEARIGETVEFRYRVINEGSGDASNVWIKNPLPVQLQHPEGKILEYEVGELPAGQSRDVILQLVAAAPGAADNSAVVTADGIAGDRASAKVSILGPQLKVTRRGPSRRYLNRDAIYENTVTNTTRRDAENARLVEYVPDGMTFIKANNYGQYNEAKRTITWPIERIRAGESQTYTSVLKPNRAGRHDSLVEIIEVAGKSKAQSRTEVVHLDNMGLKLSELDGPVAVGETVVFSIDVRNRGTSTATRSVLTLQFPPELDVINAGPLQANVDGNTVRFPPVPSIEPGGKMRFQVSFKAKGMANNVRLRAAIRSDQMPRPLPTEESITIFDEEMGSVRR